MTSAKEVADEATLIERALRWTEGFALWPAHAMNRLLATARLARYQRGAAVAATGDELPVPEILALVSGQLAMMRTMPDGTNCALGFVGAGRVIVMSGGVHLPDDIDLRFQAHSDAVVVHLPSPLVLELLDSEPKLWRDMGRMLLRQQREALATLLDLAIGGIRQRLAATIDRLATVYGVSEGPRHSLRMRLSQEELAVMLQATRQTINRELRLLEKSGVITTKYKSLSILDREALRRIAGRAH